MPDLDNIPYVRMIRRAETPEELRAIPILGDVLDSLNAIEDFVEYGCYPNWTVWIDTLMPALGAAILQLLDFGMGDVIRGYFRPSGTRGIGIGTRRPVRPKKGTPQKRRWGLRPIQLPETGNQIGKRLPGSQFFRARKVTGLERYLWSIDMTVQRALWYWLVADVTSDFITNWTTAIMESEACRKDTLGTVAAEKPEPQNTTAGSWGAHLGWTTLHDDTPNLWSGASGTLVIPQGYHAYISYQADSGAPPAFQNDGMQLRVGLAWDYPGNITTPYPVTAPDQPKLPALAGINQTPGGVQTLFKCYGTGLNYAYNGRFSASIMRSGTK